MHIKKPRYAALCRRIFRDANPDTQSFECEERIVQHPTACQAGRGIINDNGKKQCVIARNFGITPCVSGVAAVVICFKQETIKSLA